jgi:hypothetical protein
MTRSTQPQPHGILWEGPSPLDGAPIVAISVWSDANRKTGKCAQVYILRSDQSPIDAIHSGDDVSICGHCCMRSPHGYAGRGCYVQVGNGPLSVYRTYLAGKYQRIAPELFAGVTVRWGAYGDPAMLPEQVVLAVNAHAAAHLGYTHQWRLPFAQWTRGVLMASVETLAQEKKAHALGWGTFRAGASDGSDTGENAVVCANERTGITCAECGVCDGRQLRIVIPAHGWGARSVPANRLLRKKAA